MDEPKQSRTPTIVAVVALGVALYNGSRVSEGETAARYSITNLQEQVDSQANEIEILTTELARSQNALLTLGEAIKTTNTLIDVLRDDRDEP